MIRRIAHILLSCWLSVLLLFGGTAKEFIHLFTSHEDTVHCLHQKGELSFEREHHHCSFLSFSLTPFIQQEIFFFHDKEAPCFYEYSETLVVLNHNDASTVVSLRGPPAIC